MFNFYAKLISGLYVLDMRGVGNVSVTIFAFNDSGEYNPTYSGEYNPTSIFLLRLGKNIVDGKYGQSITKLQFERRQTTQFSLLTQ